MCIACLWRPAISTAKAPAYGQYPTLLLLPPALLAAEIQLYAGWRRHVLGHDQLLLRLMYALLPC